MGKVLINKKTGKPFHTSDPDAVLKKYPKAFRAVPATKLPNDITVKEEEIVSKSSTTEEKQKTKSTSSKKDQ